MGANGSSATTSCRRCPGGWSRSSTGCSGCDAAYYALAQIAVVAAFAAVWATARPLVGAIGALVAVLILDGLHYFHFTAAKFNHDVVQLPLWALAGYAFHAGLRRGRMIHWVLLGLAIGLALWAKYFVDRAGGAAGAVPADRPRRAQGAGDAGPMGRARGRARGHGAASRLAGAQRFPALRLCQRARRARRAGCSITSGIRSCSWSGNWRSCCRRCSSPPRLIWPRPKAPRRGRRASPRDGPMPSTGGS